MDRMIRSHKIGRMSESDDLETTYPLRAASRLTGLSPDLLRAWESRYGVVNPLRTAGGTRRYRATDLERLRMVKAAVDAGQRIGVVARLDPAELARRTREQHESKQPDQGAILLAFDRLDAAEARKLLAMSLSAMGAVPFARDFALPLAREVGERWANKRMSVAAEHLATGVLRSMLGSALSMPSAASQLGPTIVFATPTGEPHELGLQSAALAAMGAGANSVYLGSSLPLEEMIGAVTNTRASALALSLVTLSSKRARDFVVSARSALPEATHLWIGGAGATEIAPIAGVECIVDLEALERRVALLGFE